MPELDEPKKVIVIGAGMGGMAAAVRLARAGFSVEIYESADRVGGKCRTEWIGDYAFDTGPSLLTIPAVYRDLFKKTGKRLELVSELVPVDPAFTYNFHDGTVLTFPNLSLPNICKEIDLVLGEKSGDEWHTLMQHAEQMWDVARGPFIETELLPFMKLIRRRGFLRDLKKIHPTTSLQQFTRKITKDPYLAKIVDRYATYTGSDPRKVPAVLLTIAFVEMTFGAWHVRGGVGTLALALSKRCEELGVAIHLNTPVKKINLQAGKAVGVAIDGRDIQADYVISNADSEITYNRLIDRSEKRARIERRRLRSSQKSFSGFTLLIGLDNSKIDGLPPKLTHHNVFFPEDYNREFVELFEQGRILSEPTIYICAPQDSSMVKDASKEAWSVLINAPLHNPINGVDWNQHSRHYAKEIIDRLDALGLRVSERLDLLEVRSPADLERLTNAPGGSIYGRSSNGMRAAFLRSKNRSRISNLYCVGGSAHPGGGLPLVGISGEIVAESIISAQGGVGIAKDYH